jgi:hypothetical protein
MAVQYSPGVVALQAAVETVLAEDFRLLPEAARCGNVERMLELREQLDTAILHAVQVIDADDTTIAETGRSTRSWLIEEQLLSPGAASRLRRLAITLPAYPRVDAGLRDRKFSVAHAHVIVKALRQVPAEFAEIVETALLELAEQTTPDKLGEAVETLLVACGVECSSDAEQKRLTARGVRMARLMDGMHRIEGLVTPDVAAALRVIFDDVAQPAGAEDERTVPQRQHDALGEVVNHYLAHADLSAVNGERPRLVVRIDYAALEQNLRDAWGELPSGIRVGPETVRRLACDAEILPAVMSGKGAVLDMADATKRSFGQAVRRASWIEQRGRCAFPGCRRPPVDCHHIVWWSHGGPSTLENAAWLCAFHHWLVHERGWVMRRDPDRSFVFTHPGGTEHRQRRPDGENSRNRGALSRV